MGIVSRHRPRRMLDVLHARTTSAPRGRRGRRTRRVPPHVLRNAMHALTIIGFSVAILLTGAVLTESIFSWPASAPTRWRRRGAGLPGDHGRLHHRRRRVPVQQLDHRSRLRRRRPAIRRIRLSDDRRPASARRRTSGCRPSRRRGARRGALAPAGERRRRRDPRLGRSSRSPCRGGRAPGPTTPSASV